jgi:hypothetical protein
MYMLLMNNDGHYGQGCSGIESLLQNCLDIAAQYDHCGPERLVWWFWPMDGECVGTKPIIFPLG